MYFFNKSSIDLSIFAFSSKSLFSSGVRLFLFIFDKESVILFVSIFADFNFNIVEL